jgi:hypothetical protein
MRQTNILPAGAGEARWDTELVKRASADGVVMPPSEDGDSCMYVSYVCVHTHNVCV